MEKNHYTLILIALLFLSKTNAQIITTIAGNGTQGYGGDGGPAINAVFNNPYAVAFDNAGNLYIADWVNDRIRKVNTSGIISTFAGTGVGGYSGDGGLAVNAQIDNPAGIATDALGNVYIADNSNNRIRKVNSLGIISTFAGNGTIGFSGDGLSATSAQIYYPNGVCTDASGNVYIADTGNDRVRKVNTSGIISTVAGNGVGGFAGDGGVATSAQIWGPCGLVVDGSGNLYIGDAVNSRVRKVNVSGIISTYAGNGVQGFSGDGSFATLAELNAPQSLAVDVSGNLYIGDRNNQRIRKVNAGGVISTLAGTGVGGFSGDGGSASLAQLFAPSGVATDASGNLFIADESNQRIRKITLFSGIFESQTVIFNSNIYFYDNKLYFKKELNENSEIEIYSYKGEKEFFKSVEKGHNSPIDLSELSNGIYFVKQTQSDKLITMVKILK